jgi:uncharacterized membrane protein YqgA involved in biofilm formation
MPIGTFINAGAIIVGSFIGLLLHKGIPDKIKTIVFQALGLSTILIGVQMALKVQDILVVIFSLLLGAIIGEIINLENNVEKFGNWLKKSVKSDNHLFTDGFCGSSVLFCIGALAILGPLNEGLKGDRTILLTKSLLDGFSAIAFASTYGIGVMFSVIPLLIYQGGITVFSSYLQSIMTPLVISQLTAVGGLLIIGIGFNLLEIKKIKVTNMLPALLLVIILSLFIK